MPVFLDANVLFSAAKADGAVRALVAMLLSGGHACWVDAYVVEEARRNLAAKHPARVDALEALLTQLQVAETCLPNPQLDAALELPEKDRPVLAAAIHHGCTALVTGDRTHFGPLYGKTIHNVTIHSPRSLAEWLLG
jgi:predicted nucleic acid-binding protein